MTYTIRDTSHMQIRLKVKGKLYDIDLAKQLRIDKMDIKKSFLNQATAVGYWGTLRAIIEGILREYKRIFEKIKARLKLQLQAQAFKDGITGVSATEKEVSLKLVLHPKYDKALKKLNKLQEYADYARAATIALSNRKAGLKGILYERHRESGMTESEEY